MTECPGFSVIIPAFNAEGFLARAVSSVIEQTRPAHEIIIVDDDSKDGTFAVAQTLAAKYPCIRLIRLEINSGPSIARNRGIEASTGDWLAILDADDAFKPNRLEILAKAIETTGNPDIVSDLICLFDGENEFRPEFNIFEAPTCIDLAEFLERSRPDLGCPDFGLLKPVFRKEYLNRVGIKYPENCRHGEDALFMTCLLINSATYYVVPVHGYRYTIRNVGTSRTIIDYQGMKATNAALANHPVFQRDARAGAALDIRIQMLEQLDRDFRYQLSFRKKIQLREYRLISWVIQRYARNILDRLRRT